MEVFSTIHENKNPPKHNRAHLKVQIFTHRNRNCRELSGKCKIGELSENSNKKQKFLSQLSNPQFSLAHFLSTPYFPGILF